MHAEKEIFQRQKVNFNILPAYGFEQTANGFFYIVSLLNKQFNLQIYIDMNGQKNVFSPMFFKTPQRRQLLLMPPKPIRTNRNFFGLKRRITPFYAVRIIKNGMPPC